VFFVNALGSIRVGVTPQAVWVCVQGKGSFQNSTPLKDFAREMLSRGHVRFVIDLAGCPLMDSTFMGTLAGIALKLQGRPGGRVEVVNSNERTRGLLTNLGLDQLLILKPEKRAALEEPQATRALELGGCDKETRASTMLEAHEAVVEANPANEAKFKDVLEYLRQDLGCES
jgi:anti-anti-sigma regulatory factor